MTETKTFYISDTHWCHKNLIKFGNRPFSTIEEMNLELVHRWNSVIGLNDTVWHLGDFALGSTKSVQHIFHALHGNIHLCRGNHEKSILKPAHLRALLKEIVDYKELVDQGRKVILMHYPIESWRGKNRESIHLHGHVHKGTDRFEQSSKIKNRYNVNCEFIDYTPKTLEEILR